MSTKFRIRGMLKVGIIVLILYGITAIIYLTCFHKPIEPIFGDANELVKTWDQDNMKFILIGSFFVCLFLSIPISYGIEEFILSKKSVISTGATIKKKTMKTEAHGSFGSGYAITSGNYILTFETEAGSNVALKVPRNYYDSLMEGNTGVLNYRQGISRCRFVSFSMGSVNELK